MSNNNAMFAARREARAAVASKIEALSRKLLENAAVALYDPAELQTVIFDHMQQLEALCESLRGRNVESD